MNAPVQPEAVDSATARPTTKSTPAVPCDFERLLPASVTICFAVFGATAVRFFVIESVADGPKRPTSETRTMSPGKIERTA
jgi:hypothetical protein